MDDFLSWLTALEMYESLADSRIGGFWEWLTNPKVFNFFLEFTGMAAGSISGIRLASAKHFDWFGAYVVGLATALGGGTTRDILLGQPVFWMRDPTYLIVTLFALVAVVIFGKWLISQETTWFIFDTIGLGVFTVIGYEKAVLVLGYPWWTGIVMGIITGAGGGIMRDILINEVPLIFRKEIYATACLAGSAVFAILDLINIPIWISALIGGATVMLIRILAVKYKLQMPSLKDWHLGSEKNRRRRRH